MSQPAIDESYRVNLLGGYRGFVHHGLLELRVGECPKELDCFRAVGCCLFLVDSPICFNIGLNTSTFVESNRIESNQ